MMNTVFIVEAVLREVVRPHKVNLASLGNAVPHVHWHVIPRALDDRHFPAPVWASPQRERPPRNVDVHRLKTRLFERLSEQE